MQADTLHSSHPLSAGVGLSYCDAVGCEESTDSTVARDMSLFVRMLVDFFGFEDNDVYITGESYAGVFVPTGEHEYGSMDGSSHMCVQVMVVALPRFGILCTTATWALGATLCDLSQ